MSESTRHGDGGVQGTDSGVAGTKKPRAIVHKRILDEAKQRPDAPMEAIARDVTGANTSLVEKVLDEYGDPAHPDDDGPVHPDDEEFAHPDDEELAHSDDDRGTVSGEIQNEERATEGVTMQDENLESQADLAKPSTATSESSGGLVSPEPTDVEASNPETERDTDEMPTTSEQPVLDPNSLTSKQRETLREIYRDPEATQAELAERFGVTSATINQRVNSIDGFDWSNRRRVTQMIFRDSEEDDLRGGDGLQGDGDLQGDDVTSVDTRDDEHDDGSNKGKNEAERDEFEGTIPSEESENGERSDGAVSSFSHDDTVDADYDEFETIVAEFDTTVAEFDSTCTELTNAITELSDQVERLETRVEETSETESSVWIEPELAHKVAHACLQSEQISEEEELRIFNALINPVN